MDEARNTQFTMLWAHAEPSLFAFISAGVGNYADAEDVLQRVAVAAVRKFRDYDECKPFVAWAIGIAKFEILGYLRGKSTDRHRFVADSLEHVVRGFEAIASELEERRDALADCLKRVQTQWQVVLEKRYSEGMSVAAIAEQMKLTEDNVSVMLHRARAALRKCIDGKLNTGTR